MTIDIFLSDHKLFGLALGLATFLIIGLFHPLVIKAEYYIGVKSWVYFLMLGIAFAILAVYIDSNFFSALLGVTSFSSFWSILEVFEQERRVQKGWFPANPNKKTLR